MDALSNNKLLVYFGGTYTEQWTEDYKLTIAYENRRFVEAQLLNGKYIPTGGDAEIFNRLLSDTCSGLERIYFDASAEVAASVSKCLDSENSLLELPDFLHSSNPLSAAELMRCLMDDCAMSIEDAFRICALCCENLKAPEIKLETLYAIQPRTANVLSVIRQKADSILALKHDSTALCYRSPFGAVEENANVYLSFLRISGEMSQAKLVLFGDCEEQSFDMFAEGDLYYVNLTAPGTAQAMYYAFRIESDGETYWLCPDSSGFRGILSSERRGGFRLTVYRRGFETPAWFRSKVMYQIFPDRFAFSDDDTAKRGIDYHISLGQRPELHADLDEPVRYKPRSFETDYTPDDFYGGTFKGIEEKLGYLKNLGVGVIYLNPIVEARSNHRYDSSDYSRPDPILGSLENFEALCTKAEALGMRLILDGVFSHTGDDSLYFDKYSHYGGKGAYNGEVSEFYPWYDFKSFPDEYRCWWGFESLPEVDECNERWQDFIISGDDSIVKLWLRRGASGWRLDVADELPDKVLAMIRDAVKSEKSDAPIIGEVWEDAVIKESYGVKRNYALGYSLDSVMNYPLRTAILDFAHKRSDAYTMRSFLISQQMNYPKPLYYSLMNLLGSHDVERLRTALATDTVLKNLPREAQLAFSFDDEAMECSLRLELLCSVIQFSLPGVPSIYYGDEQGMCGVCDPFNRLPFKEDNAELHAHYSKLAATRNASPALSTGHAKFFAVSQDVLLILRYITDGKDTFAFEAENAVYLSVINRGETDEVFSLGLEFLGLPEYNATASAMSAEIIKLM